MRLFIGILFVLLGIGVMLMTRKGNGLSDGQAGYSYVENEDGTLERQDGTRGAGATGAARVEGSD